jgi:N-6 DNA Methylase
LKNVRSSAVEDQLSLFMNESASHQPVVHDPVVITSNQNSFELVALPAASLAVPEDKQVSDCEWVSFFRIHGRVPMLGDDKKPWEYSGWLLYYRMLLEEHPAIPKRWEYWCRAMSAGRVLDDAIPQIVFGESGAAGVVKLVDKWIRLVCDFESSSSAMHKLADWFLWGFGLSKEPPGLSVELNERLYREVNLGPLLLQPYDCLGEWMADQKGSWNPHAFFPTPHCVVEMMTRMNLGENEDIRAKTVCDPCVGSGRMLLHASNHSLRLYGTDIDPLIIKICKINGALYAPWMVRPFPESFFHAL